MPDRTHGAALFADISGFTPLAEALVRVLGSQRGTEELTHQLNLVYDALIAAVDDFGGSVIGFAGDAITCWFGGDDGRKAIAAAFAMQSAMARFASIPAPSGDTFSLAMKAAVASGPARRFLVGDPTIQVIDTVAGATLDRLAAAEHQAERGEVVLDEATAATLEPVIALAEWRTDEATGQRFAVVKHLDLAPVPDPWPPLPPDALSEVQVRPWVLAPTYERVRRGQRAFLAELRPAAALFLSFGGIDFDADAEAGDKLDAYVRWVQAILTQYEGFLIQLTIGDKGAYLYAAFGAPLAHDDDARRAVAAALDLRAPPVELRFVPPVRIGITSGVMRAGPYGGSTRRTYGAVSDAVNLSARLMQAAAPGQVLAHDAIYRATSRTFEWEPLPAIQVKGKSAPIAVSALLGSRAHQGQRQPDPSASLALIGRATELSAIQERLDHVLTGRGQIVGITGEAGLGKSRLLHEAIRLAHQRGVVDYWGECESYGTNHPYLVWQSIWQGFFGLDSAEPSHAQIRRLHEHLGAIDPALLPRLPLLGIALGLAIPDNDLTRSFDAGLRKASLEALLVDCLRRVAADSPLVLVLEDCHWIDPLSHDLLETIGRAIVDRPVLLLLAYRPPEPPRLPAPRVSPLRHFAEVPLRDLTTAETEQLIRLKLQKLAGVAAAVSPTLVARISERAQGNPFYVEELLNYLRDQSIDPEDDRAVQTLDLPTSLHRLILSRIDRLTEGQQVTLKSASIVGRVFPVRWLWGVFPELGELRQVRADLDELSRLDLTPLDQPEPDLTYAFKHPVTQEVAYASLLSTVRGSLHGQLGTFLEQTYATSLAQRLDLLAFHYDRSENLAKKREYLRKAGEAAQAAYANDSAIDYYRRVLPLLESSERVAVLLQLGQVVDVVGKWSEAADLYEQALNLAKETEDRHLQARAQQAIGGLRRRQGRHAEALEWLDRARNTFEQVHDPDGVSQVQVDMGVVHRLKGDYPAAQSYYEKGLSQTPNDSPTEKQLVQRATALKEAGTLATQQGDLDRARRLYEESLATLRTLDDKPGIANVLNNLGIVARWRGDFPAAHALHSEALTMRRQVGDRWAISYSLSNLGNVARDQEDFAAARLLHDEALAIRRQLGARQDIANSLHNLANVLREQSDFARARSLYAEASTLYQELADKWGLAYLLEDLGVMAAAQSQPEDATCLVAAGAKVRESISAPLSASERAKLDRLLSPARQTLGEQGWGIAWDKGMAMSLEQAIGYAFAMLSPTTT